MATRKTKGAETTSPDYQTGYHLGRSGALRSTLTQTVKTLTAPRQSLLMRGYIKGWNEYQRSKQGE